MANTTGYEHNANIYLSTSAERDEPNMHLIYITTPSVQERQRLGRDANRKNKVTSLEPSGEFFSLFPPHMLRNFAKHKAEPYTLTPFPVLCSHFNP